ncbi:excisionase family DNA-binding protein [Acidobacteria bacterium AH-259-D05]|nr:excisionase family DNA-binding protein [Acidobacteria bacterium AH-259-D05]
MTAQPESPNGKGLEGGASVSQTNALQPRLLSYQAATQYLSLSYWTVRHMVVEGQIPHLKVGSRVLIDVEDLNKWIEQHKEIGV